MRSTANGACSTLLRGRGERRSTIASAVATATIAAAVAAAAIAAAAVAAASIAAAAAAAAVDAALPAGGVCVEDRQGEAVRR